MLLSSHFFRIEQNFNSRSSIMSAAYLNKNYVFKKLKIGLVAPERGEMAGAED